MAAAASVAHLVDQGKTGLPGLDRLDLRGRIAAAVLLKFPSAVTDARYMRAMMSISQNELPAGYKRDPTRPLAGIVGDQDARLGPSVGPLQVYRGTAVDLGLWKPPAGDDATIRAAYVQNADRPFRCIRWGVAVFAEKLKLADGDFDQAIRRYNGSGERAEAYRDRALAFARETWGGLA